MLSICLPFYRNPGMLAEQYRVWASYDASVKAQIEIVLVDDGSPEPAIDVPRPDGLPPLRIFRVIEDRPWHQHGARNLAADQALGPWLFLTDMDHVLPAASAVALLELLSRSHVGDVFTFARLDAPDLRPKIDGRGIPHPHCNTFALTRSHFWDVGGYDEDCVGYGTDGYFRQRLFASAPAIYLDGVPIVRYPREVIADANTPAPAGQDPRAFRNAGRRSAYTRQIMAQKAVEGLPPKTLDFPWMQVWG